jgi:hypothetical protein
MKRTMEPPRMASVNGEDQEPWLEPRSSARTSVDTAARRVSAPVKSTRASLVRQVSSAEDSGFGISPRRKRTARKAAMQRGTWPRKAHLQLMLSAMIPAPVRHYS